MDECLVLVLVADSPARTDEADVEDCTEDDVLFDVPLLPAFPLPRELPPLGLLTQYARCEPPVVAASSCAYIPEKALRRSLASPALRFAAFLWRRLAVRATDSVLRATMPASEGAVLTRRKTRRGRWMRIVARVVYQRGLS